jgi:translocator protein
MSSISRGLTFREEHQNLLKTTVSLLIPQAVVIWGAWYTISNEGSWYKSLEQPYFDPPSWFFGRIWIGLFVLMGVASYLVWKQTSPWYSRTMTWYWTQMAVSTIWALVFFGMHSPLLGSIVIIPLWFLMAICVFAFSLRSRIASALLVPYFLWVSFAVTFNVSIYCINR